jgi:hypothetical protein
MKKKLFKMLGTGMLLLGLSGTAQAIQIDYSASDLADTTTGSDLWQYTYSISDHTFNEFEGFQVFFDYGLYEDIIPQNSPGDWDVISWDPDLILGAPDDGVYDGMALAPNASLSDNFIVTFSWLGNDMPGSQYFEIYNDAFDVVEFGQTAPAAAPVPEPATLALMGTGLVGLAGMRKKQKAKNVQLTTGRAGYETHA